MGRLIWFALAGFTGSRRQLLEVRPVWDGNPTALSPEKCHVVLPFMVFGEKSDVPGPDE
jgi:hypothetical protein